MALLRVTDLTTTFATDRGPVRAVESVSFDVEAGETVGLVGESGCGKSVTALSLMRLLPTPPATYESGRVEFEGKDLLAISEREMLQVRGNQVSMVFQEPMTSLNPVYTVGWQIIEAIRLHQDVSRSEARTKAIEMLRLVGIAAPERNIDAYPHQLSGGMRQRVMIAMALSCKPSVLIADEPTTALDVTIQAQILELIDRLKREFQMGVLLITHDLSVVAEYTSSVLVMYAGQVVERGPVARIFEQPQHPYTRGLLASLPSRARTAKPKPRTHLPVIEGMVPDMHALPKGCRFSERCNFVAPHCREEVPQLEPSGEASEVRCFRWKEIS